MKGKEGGKKHKRKQHNQKKHWAFGLGKVQLIAGKWLERAVPRISLHIRFITS